MYHSPDALLWETYNGHKISDINIQNRNIYNTLEKGYDNFLFKMANKFHFKTRSEIIKREMLLHEGDPFSYELMEESARNIRKRLVLYDAWIEPQAMPDGSIVLNVITIDQWSLSGGINVLREGNETKYKIGLQERNLLGMNQFLDFNYYSQSDDDDYLETRFWDMRLMGKPLLLNLNYSNDPQNKLKGIRLSKPYYNLNQNMSYVIGYTNYGGRNDIYNNADYIAQSYTDGDWFDLAVSYRNGNYYNKLGINFNYLYEDERTYDRSIYSAEPYDSLLAQNNFPDDSVYHRFGIGLNCSLYDFVKFRKIDGFGYTEDFETGLFASVDFKRAFDAGMDKSLYDRLSWNIGYNFATDKHLLMLDYYHDLWFHSGTNLRRMTSYTLRFYHHQRDFMTFAFRALYLSDKTENYTDNLSLGGTNGIRGYNKYFQTGDRKLVVNMEQRFYSGIKILSVMLGAVVFMDMGQIWKDNDSIMFDHLYASGGFGLRLAFDKSSKNIVRIDLAYSKINNWQLSIATRQYFSAKL